MRIPAYIIHLQTQPHRKEQIEKALADIPIFEPTFVDAVNGASIPDTIRKQSISPDYYSYTRRLEMTPGEWGCAMSHLNCCKQFLTGSHKVCAVLEDDVLLSRTLPSAILACLPWMETNCPRILLLSTNVNVWKFGKRTSGPYTIFKVLYGAGAYGFLMNRAAATIRLSNGVPFRTPCDWWASTMYNGIEIRAISPHQTSYLESREDSTIEPQRVAINRLSPKHVPSLRESALTFFRYDLYLIFVKTVTKLGLAVRLRKTW